MMQRLAFLGGLAGGTGACLFYERRTGHLRAYVEAGRFSTLQGEMRTAVMLALACGRAMRETGTRQVEFKDEGAIDPVTATDEANENLVTETLRRTFPDHKIIGEEEAAKTGIPPLTASPTWIIDPIDGTQNFVHAAPLSCVSIGFCVNHKPVLGVVYEVGGGDTAVCLLGPCGLTRQFMWPVKPL